MTTYVVNLETLEMRRKREPRVKKTRWVAIHPDGKRYVMHKEDGCWWYSGTAGAGPRIEDAIADAAVYGIEVVQ